MTPEEHFLFAVDGYMMNIRLKANNMRLQDKSLLQYTMPHMRYLIGRLHGVIFGMSAMLIDRGTFDRLDIEYAYASSINEASYLSDQYIYGDHMQ